LEASLARSTQRGPGAAQVVAPVAQAHVPEVQAPRPQALPQAPQLSGSLGRLAQVPGAGPQVVSPDGQVQAPATQLAPLGHRCRQVPQESGLAWRSKQTPSQAAWPAGQATGFSEALQASRAAASSQGGRSG
jgi:hypothetical protein